MLGLGCLYWSDIDIMNRNGTYAFWRLNIVLYYSSHALEFRAHVGTDANQLDRVAQAHLAFRVHESIPYELRTYLGSRFFDLTVLAFV